jgi:hypothetical protein
MVPDYRRLILSRNRFIPPPQPAWNFRRKVGVAAGHVARAGARVEAGAVRVFASPFSFRTFALRNSE